MRGALEHAVQAVHFESPVVPASEESGRVGLEVRGEARYWPIGDHRARAPGAWRGWCCVSHPMETFRFFMSVILLMGLFWEVVTGLFLWF